MLIYDRVKALKKSGVSVKVRYGKTLTAEGVITAVLGDSDDARVFVKTSMGEYGIPISSITKITDG